LDQNLKAFVAQALSFYFLRLNCPLHLSQACALPFQSLFSHSFLLLVSLELLQSLENTLAVEFKLILVGKLSFALQHFVFSDHLDKKLLQRLAKLMWLALMYGILYQGQIRLRLSGLLLLQLGNLKVL